jgi:hypothetical protein
MEKAGNLKKTAANKVFILLGLIRFAEFIPFTNFTYG